MAENGYRKTVMSSAIWLFSPGVGPTGTMMLNVLPLPSALSILMRPPSNSTRSRMVINPNPVVSLSFSGLNPHPRRCALHLRRLVALLAGVAGLAVTAMVLVTCVDVVGRKLGHPLARTYDLVEILGAISIIGALPYTPACKGHVAIDFLPHRRASLKERIMILRHSDKGNLTLGTYTTPEVIDLRGAIERLPGYPWPVVAEQEWEEKVA